MSVSVCFFSACLLVCLLACLRIIHPNITKFSVYRILPVTVARSFYGGVACTSIFVVWFSSRIFVFCCTAVGYHASGSVQPEIVSSVTLPKTVRRLIGESISLQCLFTGRSGS